jgi:uncharacterized circularly permuted ATP-grasp superfamily protein/uncharacterized alpha-E superfamily protein
MSTPSSLPVLPDTLAEYRRDPGRHDELLDDAGRLRSHWQGLFAALGKGPAIARRAIGATRRLIAENGVTYNVYADPQGTDRPWTLDPLPLLLPADEWPTIEAGLAQRARLLDALLADLYGPQRLIAEGIVPAEIPFGHPNFLWACHGVRPASGRWLTIYAADLARGPDGGWWVLSDRTQAPSGAGYALENREIVEQVLPGPLGTLGVRRIGGAFGRLRDELLRTVVDDDDAPLAAVLTPGPYNETYFEHAYLARRLGLALAEGSDLTVRDDTLYLKTLRGLRRVHTLLRRLDDDYCDPLELRGDSALGIPGLLGAVRAGRVRIANELGSGVLESAAWLGFLPPIAERLLGERLILPSVATWWCGERPALEYVLAHLDELVIKPAYPNQRFEPIFGAALSSADRAELSARLRAFPHTYVAQEYVSLSQAPVWRRRSPHALTAKAVSIRIQTHASGAGYEVVPGGLARIAPSTAANIVSTQRGGGSKDLWVLRDAPTAPAFVPAPVAPRLPRPQDEIPSRLVENLYWFGRYGARAEDKTRLLRAAIGARGYPRLWATAVAQCRATGLLAAGGDLAQALADEQNPFGLPSDVRRLVWCAGQIRERLSAGCWAAVAAMQRLLQGSQTDRDEVAAALDELGLSLTALAGFALDDMTQDSGWRLLRIGRSVERLQITATRLALHLREESIMQAAQVEWTLGTFDSLRMYRQRYVTAPRLAPMLDLLVRDADHPRSIGFLHRRLESDLARIGAEVDQSVDDRLEAPPPCPADDELLALEQAGDAGSARREALGRSLDELASAAGRLSDRISARHFAHIALDARAILS